MLTAISMFSPCTQWVFGPLSPVSPTECIMAKPKKTEVQRLKEDTPRYLRFQESTSTLASTFDDKPSGNNGQDDTPPPSLTPSVVTQLPDPQPTPSPSGFLSSVSGPSKPKPISKSLTKALGMDDDGWQKFLLTAELLRQSMGSSDGGKFSILNPDKFDRTKPEKLETFEAQCRSVYLSNKKKYADPSHQALFAGPYLEGATFEWWKGKLKKSTADFKVSTPMFWINLWNHFRNLEHWRVIEEHLTFLQMKETDHINRHLTTFENLASQTSWNKEALWACLYWSFSHRLCEDLGLCDPTTISTLSILKTRVLQIDHRYWERQEEMHRDKGRQGYSDGSGGSKKPPRSPSSSSSSSSPSPLLSGPLKNQNKPNPAPLSFMPCPNTDTSGRITAEERKCRMDNKLCLYCEKEGHGVRNCPVSDAKSKKKAAGNSSKTSRNQLVWGYPLDWLDLCLSSYFFSCTYYFLPFSGFCFLFTRIISLHSNSEH